MRRRPRPVEAALATVLVLAAAWSCGQDAGNRRDGAARDEPLLTEEVAGAIDAELSTEEDPRGPRWAQSGKVLPPGFPVDLPVAVGLAIVETGATAEGERFVVFESQDEPAKLVSAWRSLLESEGWSTSPVSDTHFTAGKEDTTVRAIVAPFGSGSRLRVVYR